MSQYEAGILRWSEHQAALLHRRATGEFVTAKLYRHALRETIEGQAPLPVTDVCPVTLDELLAEA
jgi:hypothetical protein